MIGYLSLSFVGWFIVDVFFFSLRHWANVNLLAVSQVFLHPKRSPPCLFCGMFCQRSRWFFCLSGGCGSLPPFCFFWQPLQHAGNVYREREGVAYRTAPVCVILGDEHGAVSRTDRRRYCQANAGRRLADRIVTQMFARFFPWGKCVRFFFIF